MGTKLCIANEIVRGMEKNSLYRALPAGFTKIRTIFGSDPEIRQRYANAWPITLTVLGDSEDGEEFDIIEDAAGLANCEHSVEATISYWASGSMVQKMATLMSPANLPMPATG